MRHKRKAQEKGTRHKVQGTRKAQGREKAQGRLKALRIKVDKGKGKY
jgi:hypothetical protein